ncbi:MAG: L,D-transpeptidase family protein [Planctomycetes bacterium]|nr:L,D-transpeptidase family protein [Planctomycetota bacterium]
MREESRVARETPPVSPETVKIAQGGRGDRANATAEARARIEPPAAIANEADRERGDTPVQTALGTDGSDRSVVRAESPMPPVAKSNPPPGPDRTRAQQRVESGLDLLARNKPLEARRALSRALLSGSLDEFESDRTREQLRALNERLVFSPEIVENDPYTQAYIVQPNEFLSTIVKDQGLAVDWRFILRINGIREARNVRAGQRLKLISGPFHAVIDKSAYRLDLYLGRAPNLVYVASYPVGLGEFNSTPTGLFQVRVNSKLIDPGWTNPRTRQYYASKDPENPIGERWIGLQGLDEHNRDLVGYGIHGTIQPESIGRQSSMGCIRMLPEDVEIVFEVLVEGASTIEIRP